LAETAVVTQSFARKEQALRVALMRDMASVWRTEFDLSDVRGSSVRITQSAIERIEPVFQQSTANGAAYYQQVRGVAGVPGTVAIAPVTYSASAVQTTIGYTSRVSLLRAITAGRTPEQAAHTALIRTIGEASRLASMGGRETVVKTMANDPRAHGYQRVTGSEPCAFCAMISGRGPVYKAETVDFKAHSFCKCESEPVFSRDRMAQMSEQAIRYKELYDEAARGSDDPLAAFRSAYYGTVPRSTGPSREVRSIVGRPPAPPAGLSEAALAERMQSHVAWAQGQGWNVTVDGRDVVREMTTERGTRRIVERVADHGQFIIQETTLDGKRVTRASQLRG
jgi:hypothetical protein